jgi:AcrR family transcriptional regulator
MAGNRKNSTREKIKDVAQQLIAEHGVDGISIRDIIIAAGQRNMASLYYYFRSKEELIKELVYDANQVMEGTRTDYLAKIEEIGEPLTVRQIVHVILSGGAKLDPSQGGRNATIMRFFGAVTQTHRSLFEEAIGGQISPTSLKCMELLRQKLAHIPPAIVNQRLMFLWFSATSVLIAREEGLAAGGQQRAYWSQPGTYLNILDFMCGALQAPVTQAELSGNSGDDLPMIRYFITGSADPGGSHAGEDAPDTFAEVDEAVMPARKRAGTKK